MTNQIDLIRMGRHARVVGWGSLVAACLVASAANAADPPAFGAQLGIGGGARIAPGEERGAVVELVPRAELLFGELRSIGPAVEIPSSRGEMSLVGDDYQLIVYAPGLDAATAARDDFVKKWSKRYRSRGRPSARGT